MEGICMKLLFSLLVFCASSFAQEGETCDDIKLCALGYSCHPAQGICYEDAPPTKRLHIWLGNGPNQCIFSPYHCSYFDMDYDMSHINGGGDWCDTGMKIRCRYKYVKPSPPPTPANELVVLAYNIFERGWFISADGQRERSCRIPRVLSENWPEIDVICFQETFRDGCWPELSMRDLLRAHGFKYQTKTVVSPKLTQVENGGIFVASRWPILEEDMMVFTTFNPETWDRFAAKGVSYAKINKTVGGEEKIYHVMSTHFQAGGPDSVKHGQASEWQDFVIRKNIPEDEAVIFAGDLNMNNGSKVLEESLGMLGASFPDELRGKYDATADPNRNQILHEKNPVNYTRSTSWIDHVLYSHFHLIPTSSYNEIIIPRDSISFPVCFCDECIMQQLWYRWPESWDKVWACPESKRRRIVHFNDLSDHFPILGVFKFDNKTDI